MARLLQIYILKGTKIGKGGPVLAAKIGQTGPILAAKVVRGDQFGKNFCQNWSGPTDFRGTDFGVTGQ